jgi:hypothetical protein
MGGDVNAPSPGVSWCRHCGATIRYSSGQWMHQIEWRRACAPITEAEPYEAPDWIDKANAKMAT